MIGVYIATVAMFGFAALGFWLISGEHSAKRFLCGLASISAAHFSLGYIILTFATEVVSF